METAYRSVSLFPGVNTELNNWEREKSKLAATDKGKVTAKQKLALALVFYTPSALLPLACLDACLRAFPHLSLKYFLNKKLPSVWGGGCLLLSWSTSVLPALLHQLPYSLR